MSDAQTKLSQVYEEAHDHNNFFVTGVNIDDADTKNEPLDTPTIEAITGPAKEMDASIVDKYSLIAVVDAARILSNTDVRILCISKSRYSV